MSVSSVAAFWAVALLLIIVPGADWAFILGAGLQTRTVVPAVSGLALGYAAITIMVVAGVGALAAGSSLVLTMLTVAGGLYLISHGVLTFGRPAGSAGAAGAATEHGRALLLKGVGVSALNPKGLLVLLALLPQYCNPNWTWPVGAQLGLLGLVFVASCAIFYFLLGTFARRVVRGRPGITRAITRFSAAAMVVIGALLLAERLID